MLFWCDDLVEVCFGVQKCQEPSIRVVATGAATPRADDSTPSRRIERVCDDAIDVFDATRSMWSFPQAIKTYTYEYGEPLKIIDAEPKRHSYPEHERIVVRSTARRGSRSGSGEPPETIYNLYSKVKLGGDKGHRWDLRKGIAYPTHALNVEKLKACADNSQNAWGSSITGTLEQVDARTLQQYEDLYTAVGADATTKISIRQANLKVNGASLLFRYMRSFRT